MKIIHRLSFNAADGGPQSQILDELKIPYHFTPLSAQDGIVTLEIPEDHEHWVRLSKLSLEWDSLDVIRTEFSNADLDEAEYLVVRSPWVNGYPMPDNDGGYLDVTYGGSGCQECGSGRRQSAAFQLRSEPKWGRRGLMQINWIVDEFFAEPSAFRSLFANFGVAARDVHHYKKKTPLKTVVQLEITTVAESPLQLGVPDNRCGSCGQARYKHQSIGFFPNLANGLERAPIFRTREHFGEGGVTWTEIIVSQEVYRAIKSQKLRAVDFHPLRRST